MVAPIVVEYRRAGLRGGVGFVGTDHPPRVEEVLPSYGSSMDPSGMLFSYNLFNRLSATRPDAQPALEYPLAYVLTTELGSVLGVMMGIIILMVLHDRRRAMRSSRSN